MSNDGRGVDITNVENLAPDVIRRISKEIKELSQEPMEAGTPYAGGQFRVKLTFPKDFPSSPPRGFFLTRIFHPNVAPTSGEICVNTLKKDWKPTLGVKNVLLTIKCLLIVPNAESALNEEAGKLLLDHYDDYARRAKMMTEIHARPQDTDTSERSSTFAATSSGKRPADSGGSGDDYSRVAKEKSKKMLRRL